MTNRRASTPVKVGHVTIGGESPIVIQSMTNTPTANIQETAKQAFNLYQAGSEIVRITVDTPEAAQAVPYIRDALVSLGWDNPLLVGDFHYIGHTLLSDFPECAKALAKYRINPGNLGFGQKHDTNFQILIEKALTYQKPIRIGVNWGSIDPALIKTLMDDNAKRQKPLTANAVMQEALILSALNSRAKANDLGLTDENIILSCKVSEVNTLVSLYQSLAARCPNALHLGLTEAGMDSKGIVATASAFAILLSQGIGDTIRASLTPAPGGGRTQEVRVCQEILQSLSLRSFIPVVSACPGCGRTTSTVFQSLAQDIQKTIRQRLPEWKKVYPGVVDLKFAVMGCVVNGPGESKHADIGISLPGTGEAPRAPVFVDGKKYKTLEGPHIATEFLAIIERYITAKAATAQPEAALA